MHSAVTNQTIWFGRLSGAAGGSMSCTCCHPLWRNCTLGISVLVLACHLNGLLNLDNTGTDRDLAIQGKLPAHCWGCLTYIYIYIQIERQIYVVIIDVMNDTCNPRHQLTSMENDSLTKLQSSSTSSWVWMSSVGMVSTVVKSTNTYKSWSLNSAYCVALRHTGSDMVLKWETYLKTQRNLWFRANGWLKLFKLTNSHKPSVLGCKVVYPTGWQKNFIYQTNHACMHTHVLHIYAILANISCLSHAMHIWEVSAQITTK